MTRNTTRRSQEEQNLNKLAMKVLGVKRGYTPSQLKKQYRTLILKHHPDKGNDSSGKKMAEINKAYAILTNKDLTRKEIRTRQEEEDQHDLMRKKQQVSIQKLQNAFRKSRNRRAFKKSLANLKEESINELTKSFKDLQIDTRPNWSKGIRGRQRIRYGGKKHNRTGFKVSKLGGYRGGRRTRKYRR